MTIIPAIDLKDGRCVRLKKGDFGTVHEVADDPQAVARSYRDAGARVIHVVDLDGALGGKRRNAGLVAALAQEAAPAKLELGGGLRTLADLQEADSLGVWRFVIGSAAVSDPGFMKQAVARYGERIAVGVDARDGQVRTHGWTENSGRAAVTFVQEMVLVGVQTIIYTDIDTDGMLAGPNVGELRALREAVDCRLIASGGVGSDEDVFALRDAGLSGVIIGKALYEGLVDLRRCLLICEENTR